MVKILPVLIVFAVVGTISFLLITSVGPFNGDLNNLYPKPNSKAATNQIYWGAWVGGDVYGTKPSGGNYTSVPWDPDTWNLYEQHTGKKISLTHWGEPWQKPSTPQNFN